MLNRFKEPRVPYCVLRPLKGTALRDVTWGKRSSEREVPFQLFPHFVGSFTKGYECDMFPAGNSVRWPLCRAHGSYICSPSTLRDEVAQGVKNGAKKLRTHVYRVPFLGVP